MNGKEKKRAGVRCVGRQLTPAYILVFAFCFMLFVYEPILMYSTNKNDFWFDFGIMVIPTLTLFLICLAAGAALMTALYFITGIFHNAGYRIFQCCLIALSVTFAATYIQGNFLISSLPVLTGEKIAWDSYGKENIITFAVWMILAASAVFSVIKFKAETTVKWAERIALAVTAMLAVSLAAQMLGNNAWKSKDAVILTDKHFNDISTERNFLIFLVDAVDYDAFQQVMDGDEACREVFADFTNYTDVASVYPYTRDSIPLLLSGKLNRNEEAFEEYSSAAYNHSELFARLSEENYDINLYLEEPVWYGECAYAIQNDIRNSGVSPYDNLDFPVFFREEIRYILFKYLPYACKKYANIEGLGFWQALEQYSYHDNTVYDTIISNPDLDKTDRNVFQFAHVEGAHQPFDIDENLNQTENGTYTQKLKASVKVIDAYLERLKANDVYDNSAIMIMSDHGYYDVDHDSYGDEVLERYHPILLVKGLQERHALAESDVPVSHLDFVDAYMALLDGKKGGEIFSHVDTAKKRTIIWYEYGGEDHMVEYELEGSRFDRQDFKLTGNVYDR